MTFEEAVNLFYTDKKVQDQFDYQEIDHTIAVIQIFIDDVESIQAGK